MLQGINKQCWRLLFGAKMQINKNNFVDGGVKIIKNNRGENPVVGGYGVIYGGVDLEGETFSQQTDYMPDLVPIKLICYDHAGREPINYPIGKSIKYEPDERGIWVEAELERSKQYVDFVLDLVEKGVLGWSSGSVNHLVERSGKNIVRWPIVEFSLTTTPAEPRTLGVDRIKALASNYPGLLGILEGAGDGAEVPARETTKENKRGEIMENKEQSMVTLSWDEAKGLLARSLPKENLPDQPDENPEIKKLSDQINGILELLQKSPAAKDAGYVAPDSETDHAETKSLGDFLIAVANKNTKRLQNVYMATPDTKAALAEDAGVTGGYIVPEQQAAAIFERAGNFSVLRQSGATVFNMSNRSMKIPKLNVSNAPSAGDTAYAGGVVATWEAEAAALDETEPTFQQMELVAHKLSGYTLASNELLEDTPEALENLLTILFGRAVGVKENYAFFRGSGAGEPKGILESAALVSATRSAASAIALVDLAKMMANFLPESWAVGSWFINPAAIEKIIQLVSNPLTWMENLRTGLPVSLLGLPLRVTGALPALNVAGDILLVDPTYYVIGNRRALTVAFSEHFKFTNDQGTWRFTHRVDGQPWLDAKITLENASTVVSPFVALAAG